MSLSLTHVQHPFLSTFPVLHVAVSFIWTDISQNATNMKEQDLLNEYLDSLYVSYWQLDTFGFFLF